MSLALMMDSATRPRVAPSPPAPHTPPTSPSYLILCRDCAKNFGWSGGEGRNASSAHGSDEAGDKSMGKTTRVAIVRAYEVDQGDGGGQKRCARRRRGRGEGGVGGGWLSGLSTAAPEVPP